MLPLTKTLGYNDNNQVARLIVGGYAMFEYIEERKKEFDNKKPFPKHTLQSTKEHILLEWTYNSNAIEGNTLTLSETKVALEGVTIGGKTIREHLEAINHKDAILYVEEIVQNNEPFSERLIKNIYILVLKGIDNENAGIYRNENVIISGAKRIPPDFTHISSEMEAFINWYYSEGQKQHPVERAAHVHTRFVKIHPFIDGNGRTARLLLNFELLKCGYPPVIIENEKRADYYTALDKAHIR